MLFQIVRLVAVLALVCVAAALATPKGRLPLALRGVAKLFHISSEEQRVPGWKKMLSFVLVLVAVIISFI